MIITGMALFAIITGYSLYTAFATMNVTKPDYPSFNTTSRTWNNTITVSGSSQVSASPDQAILTITIMTRNQTAEGAVASNSVIADRVLHSLNSIGISNSSIETVSYYLTPDYEYSQYSTPRIIGYSVLHTIQVNITGSDASQIAKKTGQAIDVSSKSGASQIGFYFTLSKKSLAKLEQKALSEAAFDARMKANAIASALGVNVTGVISASESYYYTPIPVFSSLANQSQGKPISTNPMPGTVTVTASIQVTFKIS